MSPLGIASFLMIVLGAIEFWPESTAGIFLNPRNYPTGEVQGAAAVQDLNNDGISDVATANGDNVSIFLNNGNGTFALANTFSVGEGPTEIASADLNGDGDADLVVTDDMKSAYTILGNGDATFAAAKRITLDRDPVGIAIADLNGDSILDLAIAMAPFVQQWYFRPGAYSPAPLSSMILMATKP